MNLAMLLDLPSMIVPDDVVVIDIDGREVSYLELRQAASQVAGMLRGLGVGSGDRVGLFATNRVGMIEVVFGTAAIGATIVP